MVGIARARAEETSARQIEQAAERAADARRITGARAAHALGLLLAEFQAWETPRKDASEGFEVRSADEGLEGVFRTRTDAEKYAAALRRELAVRAWVVDLKHVP